MTTKISGVKKKWVWSAAIKSYRGYLEGTGKSKNTISSYLSDVKLFGEFLREQMPEKQPPAIERIHPSDLERFGHYLRSDGQRTNTRRRKLLSVRRFLAYLSKRKRVSDGLGARLPAPHKHETLPYAPDFMEIQARFRDSSAASPREERDRILIWFLLETGALVSEVVGVQRQRLLGQDQVEILGKDREVRVVPVSGAFAGALGRYQESVPSAQRFLFLGWNRHGPFTDKMSPRGVELVVKHYAQAWGDNELTPRALRHAAVLEWMRSGASTAEIKKRLGLKSDYAFRIYESLFRSKFQTTTTEVEGPSVHGSPTK